MAARYSDLAARERRACLEECRALTGSIHPGLDVSIEIESVGQQSLGDTVLVRDGQHRASLPR